MERIFGFLCKEGTDTVIHHVSKCGLAETFGDIGDHAGNCNVDESDIFQCFCYFVMAVVFNSSRTVFFKNIISIFCHFVGSKKIEFVVIKCHDRLAVLDLDLFGHGIEDSGSSVANRTFGDDIHIHQNGINFMFESPAGFLGTFRSVHDTHACKGCAGGDGGRNIDSSQTGCLRDCFGKVHDLAAADADNFITVGREASVRIFFCCLKTAYACVYIYNIIYTSSVQTREQLFFYSIKSSRSRNKKCFFAESCNLLSTFFQKSFFLAVTSCSEFNSTVQYDLFHDKSSFLYIKK